MALIKFLTDSASDLPAQLREERDIEMLSFPIAFGDKEYMDGVDLAPEEFYRMLQQSPTIPTHSQLTSYVFEERYAKAYEDGYSDLIYVSINAKASSTYCNAVQAIEEFYEEYPEARKRFRIHVIDGGTYTMAYGWVVAQAAKMAREGVDVEKILTFIRNWLAHARILVAVMDLRWVKKSGRVSAMSAFVGDALGLKPIITFENGESKILTKVRGEKNIIPTMLELCRKTRKKNTPYLLAQVNNPEMSGRLRGACVQELKQEPELEYFIGGVISANIGTNAIGLIYWEK